jgi:hypothetical protein
MTEKSISVDTIPMVYAFQKIFDDFNLLGVQQEANKRPVHLFLIFG